MRNENLNTLKQITALSVYLKALKRTEESEGFYPPEMLGMLRGSYAQGLFKEALPDAFVALNVYDTVCVRQGIDVSTINAGEIRPLEHVDAYAQTIANTAGVTWEKVY